MSESHSSKHKLGTKTMISQLFPRSHSKNRIANEVSFQDNPTQANKCKKMKNNQIAFLKSFTKTPKAEECYQVTSLGKDENLIAMTEKGLTKDPYKGHFKDSNETYMLGMNIVASNRHASVDPRKVHN